MTKIDRKMAVLMALQKSGKEISLAELRVILGENYPERSLRRWLNELMAAGMIKKTGQKKGSRYQAIIKAASSNQFLFSAPSNEAIDYLKQPIYTREPTRYRIAWLESYEPNKTYYLTNDQRNLLKQHGERRYHYHAAGTYARHIYNHLLIDLSYNSSRLEGNTYSLLETEKLVLEGDVQANKLTEETVMILNHKEAIRYLVDNAGVLKIEPQVIYTLHYLLSDGLLPNQACGSVRKHAVKIGSSTYLPIDHSIQLENILRLICQKAAAINDPFEQSFFLLAHIAYLQAFEDCNKRTSRLSANIPLIRQNLVPMSFNDIPKEDYTLAMLAIYELNDTLPLIDLYRYSYLRTCKQYDVTIESIGFHRIRVQYRLQRRQVIMQIVTQKLVGKPMFEYIKQQSLLLVDNEDRAAFEATVQEDMSALSISHVAGMGISIQEFNVWKQINDASQN